MRTMPCLRGVSNLRVEAAVFAFRWPQFFDSPEAAKGAGYRLRHL